ncbi:MAG TPA: vanadium-dependent haloperoxidase [Chitinophagaceae bacterium]|nr:vanadium-dependent haloperoxidase [Chitinophagaceae bacterium]
MTSVKVKGQSIAAFKVLAMIFIVSLTSCKKDDHIPGKGPQPSKYSSEVLDKWMTLQLRLMRNGTGTPNHAYARHYAYSGIAALQSLAPGFHGHNDWLGKWNGLTGLPAIEKNMHYYYPANVNAAMAAINRSFFPNAGEADKSAIDSLENALQSEFLQTQPQSVINRSANYGKAVAAAVFNWAETDGYKNANAPYTPPVGPGLWVPTAQGATALTPYWGNNRPVVRGSLDNTRPAAPIAYSTVPGSPFYQMVKTVYDASQNLTEDQKAMAIFWRDVPGVSSPGHWLSILQQVIKKRGANLDKAALSYALTGAAINDAIISCWEAKYYYNLLRPVTYIRNVMGHGTWAPQLVSTPSHPDYPSGHAVLSGAGAEAMERMFGNIGTFTDNTYVYMGLGSRSYSSFTAIGKEAAMSRVYGGIHFVQTADISLKQGKKVTDNIFSKGKHY